MLSTTGVSLVKSRLYEKLYERGHLAENESVNHNDGDLFSICGRIVKFTFNSVYSGVQIHAYVAHSVNSHVLGNIAITFDGTERHIDEDSLSKFIDDVVKMAKDMSVFALTYSSIAGAFQPSSGDAHSFGIFQNIPEAIKEMAYRRFGFDDETEIQDKVEKILLNEQLDLDEIMSITWFEGTFKPGTSAANILNAGSGGSWRDVVVNRLIKQLDTKDGFDAVVIQRENRSLNWDSSILILDIGDVDVTIGDYYQEVFDLMSEFYKQLGDFLSKTSYSQVSLNLSDYGFPVLSNAETILKVHVDDHPSAYATWTDTFGNDLGYDFIGGADEIDQVDSEFSDMEYDEIDWSYLVRSSIQSRTPEILKMALESDHVLMVVTSFDEFKPGDIRRTSVDARNVKHADRALIRAFNIHHECDHQHILDIKTIIRNVGDGCNDPVIVEKVPNPSFYYQSDGFEVVRNDLGFIDTVTFNVHKIDSSTKSIIKSFKRSITGYIWEDDFDA